jgi:hypothetical protein
MALQLQLFLLIPRIIETALFITVVLHVNKQFALTPFRQRPFVHRLFMQGLIGWTIYIFLDIFIYTYAAASFDPGVSMRVVGYDINYPSLFFFNIMRDIAFAGLMLECWSYIFVPIAIYKGERKAHEIWNKKPVKFFIVVYSLFLVYNEKLVVLIEANRSVIITEDYEGIGALSLLSATLLFLIAAILMYYVMKKIAEGDTSPELQKKFNYFIWGFALMACGYIWAIFWNSMYVILPVLSEPIYYLPLSYVIHGFWMSSPIMINQGLKIKLPETEKA